MKKYKNNSVSMRSDENNESELNTKYFDYDKFNLIPKYYNLDIVDANQILDRLKSKGIKIKTIKDNG